MTDNSLYGTGDPLGTVDLGVVGELRFRDDGSCDPDVEGVFATADGVKLSLGISSSVCQAVRVARREHGDQAVVDALSAADTGDDDATETSWNRGPPAFKCDGGCNRSWPRSANQNPGDGDDICPECGGD